MERSTTLVLRSLNDPKYKWRTIKGICSATGLPPGEVIRVITTNAADIVQSSALSPAGETLYTTRDRHKKRASTLSRITSALRNRAD